MSDEQGYRVPEVTKAVGISYRQLDYWARTGLVTPSVRDASGSGTQRLYSFQDLVQLKVIKRLIDAGISLQRIRKAIQYLRQNESTGPSGVTLMSDGVSIYACQSEDEIIDLVKRGQGVFAIALDKVWEDLSHSLRPGAGKKRSVRPAALVRAGGA